ncbi:MAG: carbohydrate binding family 9 domain-containing protein, partial [Gammaproteobacteria bacterium]|nr:carbohydrate binding family 9 domain-containing protein [Gammaproteobacteria bacterium]
PIIDGRLDDETWRDAARIDDFHQVDPADGAPPTETTIVRVAYDDDYLYISADMHDSDPTGIRALQMIQGKLFFSDDRFYVMLDSFNSKRNDYFFQVNANGVRRDALRENNSRFIDEWETIWHAESAISDAGWSTEIAIPFKSVSFDPRSETWGINFGRGVVRKQEFVLWSSHDRQDWPAYSGEMSGIGNIEQGLGLDVIPSVIFRERRDYKGNADGSSIDPALDVRYRFSPSLSATLTLNTDFSTTEVDDQQVALDRFSLFFPEKRDFFLQDAGIFEFDNIDANGRPFFSRRIGLSGDGTAVGIDGGAKLTGRIGDYSIGALAIRQEESGDVDATDLIVLRGAKNILEESSLGFIMTHGDPASNNNNNVVGADFLYRDSDGAFGEILTSNVWAQKSRTPGLDGNDHAFGAKIEIPSDVLFARFGAEEIQENFNPALGFVNRAGIRRYETTLRYRWRPDESRWRAINHRIDAWYVTDMDGRQLSRRIKIRPVTLWAHSADFYLFEWERNKEIVRESFDLFGRLNIPAGQYTFNRYRAEVATGSQRPINVVLSMQNGDYFGGTRRERYAEIQWRQSAHFAMAATFEEQDVDLPSGSFTSHLASLRTDIAFNSRWSWINLVQYNNTADVIGVNSRLRYLPEAGKEMVLVLNHRADVDLSNRFSSNESELNLKISYTFRY